MSGGVGRRVEGTGPVPSLIMGIGEWPGKDEARSGYAFSGKTGREIDRAFDGIRLPARSEVYFTNWIKEWCGEDGDYEAADFARDESSLVDEIRSCRPALIVAMGRHIIRWFLGDADVESTHGIPWNIGICQCGKPVRLNVSYPTSSHKHQDVGHEPALGVNADTDSSGSTAAMHLPTSSRTPISSSVSQTKHSTISVETKSASIQRISNVSHEQKMFDGTMPFKDTVSGGTNSPRKTHTFHQSTPTNVSVASANERVLHVGRSCTCGDEKEWHEAILFPCYNPAAGFRAPEISATVAYDFAQLEGILNGDIAPRILYDDPIHTPHYDEILTLDGVDRVMSEGGRIATDTEGLPHQPWSVQGTSRTGEAWIIRYRHPVLIARFAEWVNACPEYYTFTFHNSLHDLSMFRAFGIDTRPLKFDDTMIMAYNLQLEPQGLKPLCGRFCGMKMLHYDEVMEDASFRLAQDWLLSALEVEGHEYQKACQEEFVRLTTTPYTDKRGIVHPFRKVQKIPSLPKSGLHKSIERCLKSARPRGLWIDQIIDRHVEAESKYGRIWDATLDHVPYEHAIAYAGRDSDGTHRLRPYLEERLRENNLLDTYQADIATVPLIDRMQQVGLLPDLPHFAALGRDLETELHGILARVHARLHERTGANQPEFNPNSSNQCRQVLFEDFGIESLKRTPGGFASTDDKVLEALEKDGRLDGEARRLIGDIREYREVYKLKHTFVDKIPALVNRWPFDGRIHPTFRITRVVTGRLAASDPNVLALPKHGKFAKRFRDGFVATEGAVLASWDLSQIELRVLAHLSQDPMLLDAFRTGKDLHATLAQRIFGVAPKDQDDSKHRLPAKAVNFGIPMGMTAIGLCLELRKNGVDVNEDDAQRWLDETMALYSRVPEYQQGKIAEARRYGYVTDIRGRRRYIGGIRSFDRAIRAESERFAFSTPIQAGAQEVMKEVEAHVYRDILLPRWKAGDYVEPLLQIHDDLVLESATFGRVIIEPHPDEAKARRGKKIAYMQDDSLHQQIVYAMTQIPKHWLSVPIETSGDAGFSWGAMAEIRKR